MRRNEELLKRIKRISWDTKQKFITENPGYGTTSVSKMIAECTIPFDADAAAKSVSTNPNHEHYGKSPEEIKSIWEANKFKGQVRGNSIDDYIKAKVLGLEFNFGDDEIFKRKCLGVDKFYDQVISKFDSFIGDEVWLSSNGINVRCDGLFTLGNSIVVAEWKNITNLKTNNPRKKCHGLLTGYDDCDLLKINIQVYTYKYILEQYFGTEFQIHPIAINFVEDGFEIIPLLFKNRYLEIIPELAKNSIKLIETN